MTELFTNLSKERINIQQATGALLHYPGQALATNLQELYGLEGITEVLLAESFCDGIPLDKAPFDSNFTYSGALTTSQVLQHAIALFDTALTYGTDSVPIVTLARVGKATVWADAHDTARSCQLALRRERLREPSSTRKDR